jgi:hypothetical protein
VIPSLLLEAANELQRISSEVEAVGDQVQTAASRAPSYDGQFGPKVHSLGSEATVRSRKLAQDLSTLANVLRNKGEDFESADLVGAEGLAGILAKFEAFLSSDLLLALDDFPIDFVTGILILGTLLRPRGGGAPKEESDWEPKLHESLVIEASNIWDWYDENINKPLIEGIGAWIGIQSSTNLIAEFYSAKLWFWYDQKINQPIYDGIETWRNNLDMWDLIWNERLHRIQEPGLPIDGPITEALEQLSAVDGSGNPISIMGTEIVRLLDERGGVQIAFADYLTSGGSAGLVPVKGYVFLPERYLDPTIQEQPGVFRLIAHELEHVFQRDLPEYPDGLDPAGVWPYNLEGKLDPLGFDYGAFAGDFTLYMEVQSNIVEITIEHDFLNAQLTALPVGDPRRIPVEANMQNLADRLATYIGDPETACAFVVQDHPHTSIYLGEMVTEILEGARIPSGGWEQSFREQGMLDHALQHIETIAGTGTPINVDTAHLLQSSDGNK